MLGLKLGLCLSLAAPIAQEGMAMRVNLKGTTVQQDGARFRADGFLVKRGVISSQQIDLLLAAKPAYAFAWYNRWLELAANSFLGSILVQDSLWMDFDIFRRFWFDGPVPVLVSQVMGDDSSVRLVTDIMYGVAVGIHPRTLGSWHFDTESYDVLGDESPGVSVWIPLTDIDARVGGSLKLVNVTRARPECIRRDTDETSEMCAAHFEDIAQTFSWKRGDVLLFSRWTFHRTQPWQQTNCKHDTTWKEGTITGNHHCLESGTPSRFVLVGRFTSGLATFGFVPGVSSQKKHTCPHNLSAGDALQSACFPQLVPGPIASEVALLDTGAIKPISNDWRMAQVLAHLAHTAVDGSDSRLMDALKHIFVNRSSFNSLVIALVCLAFARCWQSSRGPLW
jgi:hypothetical protein